MSEKISWVKQHLNHRYGWVTDARFTRPAGILAISTGLITVSVLAMKGDLKLTDTPPTDLGPVYRLFIELDALFREAEKLL